MKEAGPAGCSSSPLAASWDDDIIHAPRQLLAKTIKQEEVAQHFDFQTSTNSTHLLPSPAAAAAPHFNFNCTAGGGGADELDHHCLPIFPSQFAAYDQQHRRLLDCCSLHTLPNDHYGDSSNIINAAAYDFSFTTCTTTDQDHHGHIKDGGDDEVDAGFWNELGPLLSPPPDPSTLALLPHKTLLHHPPAPNVPTPQDGTILAAATPNYGSNANALTRESLSTYFYMPITQAARELNLGLTLLKKRCRELGLKRWPHRKLISLQTLISSLQAADDNSARLKEAIRVLEKEQKLLEQSPDLQLHTKTKRLRQACFKANYKSKKNRNRYLNVAAPHHHSISNPSPASPPNTSTPHHHLITRHPATTATTTFADDDEGDEEIKSLLLPVLHDHHCHSLHFGF